MAKDLVTIENYRRDTYQNPQENQSLGDHMVSVERAAESLICYELKFGGKIVDFDETSIEAQTTILSKVDTTIFRGSKENISILLGLAELFEQRRQELISCGDVLDKITQLCGHSTLLLTQTGPMILGTMAMRMMGEAAKA